MGQRLTITIENNNQENIATLYYHWSAYTISALLTVHEMIPTLKQIKGMPLDEARLTLIRYAEEAGGGIDGGFDSDEWKYIQAKYPNESFKKEDISRNYGLIAISQEGQKGLLSWSEGDVYVNIDTEHVDNCVVWSYNDINEYNEEMRTIYDDDWQDVTYDDIPRISCEIGSLDLLDVLSACEELQEVNSLVVRYEEFIYRLIEW